jgi:very-short-patch-repair endonuclease
VSDTTVGKPIEQVQFAREQRHSPSKAEGILWQALRNGQLGVRFRRQHPCDRFVLDFYCLPVKLAVEVDGPLHEEQVRYDRWRDEELGKLGIRVLRFQTEAVEANVVLVVDEIRRVLEERRHG